MSLSKKVVLTVSGYKISLSDSLQFYQNDQLKLIFEINKYGIDVASSFTHKTLMPLQPLTATLFIETPLGVDSIESANIEDNAVTFYLTSNQTQHIGTSNMQIKLTDDDGCQITLPSFTFEVQKNIYGNAVHVSGILLADENGNVLSDENGNTVNATATTETSKQIKDFTLKTGVSGQEDILVQDNGVTKRIKSSELAQTNAQLSQLEEKVIRPYEIHVSWFKSMEDACEYASSLYPTRVLLNLGVENVVVSSDIEVKLNVSMVGTRAKLRANNGQFRVIKYKGRRISPFEMQPTVQGIDCYEVGFLLGETDDDDAMEFVFRDMKFAYGEFGIKMRHHNYMCSFENIYCRSVQYGIYFDYASISTGGTIRDSGAHLRFTDCTFSDTKSTTDEIDSQAIKLNSGTLDGVSIHFNNCKFVALEQCVKSDSNTPYKDGYFYYNNCHFELNKKTIVSNSSYEHHINNFWMYGDGVGGHVHFSLDGSSKVFLTQGRLDWIANKLVNSNGGTLHIDLNTVTTPSFLRHDTGNAEAGFANPYTHISVNSKLINTTPTTFESTNIVGSLTTACKVLFKEFGGARTGYREVELNILNKYANNTDKGFVVELQPGGVSGNKIYIQSETGNNTLRLVYSTSKIDVYLNGRYMASLKNPHAVTTEKYLAIMSNTAPSDSENFEIVSCVQKIY